MKSWCIGKPSARYVAKMEDVLDVYAQPYDARRPLVCLDETSKELHGTPRGTLSMEPGQPQRQDYEYERHGVCNLLLATEPLRGQRKVRVTDRRTAQDFAEQLRILVDEDYPDADTLGCTTEACGFRDDYGDILAAGAAVVGVSPDPVKSHAKFKIKFTLPFALLSDPDHRVAEMYEAWGKKRMYGKDYEGILRTTYLIDEKGIITHVFPNVKVSEHSQEVLAALRGSG